MKGDASRRTRYKPWASKANPLSFLHDLLIDFYLMTTRCYPVFIYLWMGMSAADYPWNNKALADIPYGFDVAMKPLRCYTKKASLNHLYIV